MSLKNYFKRSTRGWLPEEPKNSRSKLRRAFVPATILLTATAVFSLFSSGFLFQLTTSSTTIIPPYVHASTGVSSYNVKFQGIVPSGSTGYTIINGTRQEIENTFHILYTNGSSTNTKTLNMTFSTIQKNENTYQIQLTIEGDNFSDAISIDALFSNGQLKVNSAPSIFMVSPALLKEGNMIRFGESSDWTLIGNVSSGVWKLQTAIEDQRVKTVDVRAWHATASVPNGWLSLDLGYDPESGMLVSTMGALSDVLLNKMGIKLIIDSHFGLASFSDNLNIQLVKNQPPYTPLLQFIEFVLLISSAPIASIAVAVAYRAHRKKKALTNSSKAHLFLGKASKSEKKGC